MFEFESNGINSKKLATILLALGFALIMHKGKSEVKNPKKYKPLISDIKSKYNLVNSIADKASLVSAKSKIKNSEPEVVNGITVENAIMIDL